MKPTEEDLRVARETLSQLECDVVLGNPQEVYAAIARMRAEQREATWNEAKDVAKRILIGNRGMFTVTDHLMDAFDRARAGDKE